MQTATILQRYSSYRRDLFFWKCDVTCMGVCVRAFMCTTTMRISKSFVRNFFHRQMKKINYFHEEYCATEWVQIAVHHVDHPGRFFVERVSAKDVFFRWKGGEGVEYVLESWMMNISQRWAFDCAMFAVSQCFDWKIRKPRTIFYRNWKNLCVSIYQTSHVEVLERYRNGFSVFFAQSPSKQTKNTFDRLTYELTEYLSDKKNLEDAMIAEPQVGELAAARVSSLQLEENRRRLSHCGVLFRLQDTRSPPNVARLVSGTERK